MIAGGSVALVMLLGALPAHAAVDRAIIDSVGAGDISGHLGAAAHYMDGTTEVELRNVFFSNGTLQTEQDIIDAAEAAVISYASGQGYSAVDTNTVFWPFLDKNEILALIGTPNSQPTASSLSLSLQTSTGAVGTQVSTTTGAWVTIAGQVSTTASIAGNALGDIIVEVAPTNSATSTDWTEWGRIGNSQALSLAITLQSVQIVKGQVFAWVPQNWYIKARTAGSGTVSYLLNTVKKIQ